MGCCGSKLDQDEEDMNAPLLNDDITSDNRVNYQACETIDAQKEQEFWNSVIDKTTQNLIDISNTQTDLLQETDVQERVERYRQLLGQIQIKQETTDTTYSNNVLDILSNAKPNGGMDDDQIDWLYQTMDEVQDAIQRIDIEPVGDIVIHLTMTDTNNSSIRTY
ncbi:hypothetical protein G6F57_008036 [Rhizopus arrhizus]|uniref:Uncharacterized protein n=1 Tax=Rhizopus oryzae TaxID=64495 RepID=A0A9P6XGY8_RHIOR|nr:hypothetical protein G6F23_010183 [Rhizopus arrhizus]KAG1410368.1 hypothetical protein G6F58_009182 [Rhizopus delemar]KAG0761075.1 hypothetical protein G6F24_007830 [Rhizopus arrhizus]KAG0788156.1 hypothetical protein G6F21_007410 [Rhizopus arrhizus]KAG0806259.1 hypothetical protein G6F20_011265 [Rhizopus arrhizus]